MGSPVNHILYATDFSDASSQAFRTSVAWAMYCGAKLSIIHVIGMLPQTDLGSDIANRYLREQERRAHTLLNDMRSSANAHISSVQTELIQGTPSRSITEYAHKADVDLIVTGTHGYTGIDHVMLGSIAERVICHAPCPVLSVRDIESVPADAAQPLEPTPRPSHLLVPMDFSTCALDAFHYARALARHFALKMTIVHAMEPLTYSLDFSLTHPADEQRYTREIEARLTALTDGLIQEGITAQWVTPQAQPPHGIVDAAVDGGADLIVMGTHGRSGLRQLIMGNIAAGVVRRSSIPVVTVKQAASP